MSASSYRKSKFMRRSRAVWGSHGTWRTRLVFWAGAVAIGLISVGFAKAA